MKQTEKFLARLREEETIANELRWRDAWYEQDAMEYEFHDPDGLNCVRGITCAALIYALVGCLGYLAYHLQTVVGFL